jgi:phosphatidylglycerol:prolipoprotein diacylglycerol transferase
LKLGPLTLYSYGIMMALGVALGLWFLYVQGKRQGLPGPRVLDAAFYILLVSILGAKLILLFSDFRRYTGNPRELLNLARSGGVFQGGLIFGVLFALWYFRKHKLPTWKMSDLVAPALALGHGFGRIGCFLAGCCYGRTCELPWGVTFTNTARDLTGVDAEFIGKSIEHPDRHPVQLYESLLNFANFLVLFVVLRRKKFDGQVFSLYIMNYSIIRFFTEYFRGDHPAKSVLIQGATPLASLTWPQFFCILGLAAGLVVSLVLKKRHAAAA